MSDDKFPTAEELLAEPVSEPVEEKLPDFDTAFIVLIQHNGDVVTTVQLDSKFTVSREASVKDMRRASNELLAEIALNTTAVQTANNVLGMMQQIAAAQAEEAQNAAIRNKLAARGIHIAGQN